jgi:hypothetical protein
MFGAMRVASYKGTPHETEIYVRLQRVDGMFSIVYRHGLAAQFGQSSCSIEAK